MTMQTQILVITEKPLATCGWRKFHLDAMGDHLCNCTAYSGAASDLLWVQITQSYPNRLRFSSLPCPQSPCHTVIHPVFKEGFF
jgi:hypothetical protein